jgi:ribonuclease HI
MESPKFTEVYTDAGWRKWNEAPIYIAHVVRTEDGDITNACRVQDIAFSSVYIEYIGLIYAMEYCLRANIKNPHFKNDNQTMVYQVQGRYRVHQPLLEGLHKTVSELWHELECYGIVKISWIPREENIADKYVQECKGV